MSLSRACLPLVLAAVASVTVLSVLSVPAGAAGAAQQASKPVRVDQQVTRILAGKTGIDTTSTTARCLRTQSLRALRTGKAPKAARTAKACKTGPVTVSKVIKGTKSAKATAKAIRRSPSFKQTLTTHAHLSVAARTFSGRRLVVALTASARPGGGTPGHGSNPTAWLTHTNVDHMLTLDGSGSTDDKGIVSYVWRIAPAATPTRFATIGKGATLDYTVPAYGDYRVLLTVVDADHNTGAINMAVRVEDSSEPPTAFFVQSVDYRTSQRTVVLDASVGVSKTIATYNWYLVRPDSNIHIGTGARLVWTAPASGHYSFNLIVADEFGRSDDYRSNALDVTDRKTRDELHAQVAPAMDSQRDQNGLDPLVENACVSQKAQQHADALADLHTGAPALDTAAISAACGVTVQGSVAFYDETKTGMYQFTQILTSDAAATAARTSNITKYGLGHMHSLNGWPGYYAVFLTVS